MERQTKDRQACREAGREVARQTCTVGSRTGSWRRKETRGQRVPLAEREREREGERDEVSARLAG